MTPEPTTVIVPHVYFSKLAQARTLDDYYIGELQGVDYPPEIMDGLIPYMFIPLRTLATLLFPND